MNKTKSNIPQADIPQAQSDIYLKVILIVWVFVLFFTGKNNGFVAWDDPKYVYENPFIINPTFQNLGLLLRSVIVWNFHPITMFSLWLNAFLFGQSATSFIITNALIHTLNSFLVYKFSQKLINNPKLSFLIALFWGIHPMHVESVTWVSERKDVLYVFFLLLSMLYYIKNLEIPSKKVFAGCVLFFVLACLSKGMAVILPLILLLIDYWFDKKVLSFKNLILDKWQFWLISVLIGLITINTQSGSDLYGLLINKSLDLGAFRIEASILERLYFSAFGFITYIVKFFVPFGLHHIYPYPEDRHTSLLMLSLLAMVGIVTIGLFSVKRNKVVFFGIMFYLTSILLVLQFFPVGFTILAERYTYLAYFGLLFLIFKSCEKYITHKSVFVGFIGVALIFSFISFKQIKVWKNTLTLWENTFRYHPEHKETVISLITQYRNESNQDKVIETARKAIEAGLQNATVYQSLANAQLASGDLKNSIINTDLAERYAIPEDSINIQVIYLQKATAFDGLGQKDSALFYMNKAQQILMNR